jgi:hypothetical protein
LGGDHGEDTQSTRRTDQCHDITVFPSLKLAAGACSGNGILLDISDPLNPTRMDEVTDPGFAYWHSATFNNDGTKVLFTDEWGGGTQPRCRASDPMHWGANAIYDIVDGKFAIFSRKHGTKVVSQYWTLPTLKIQWKLHTLTGALSMKNAWSLADIGQRIGTTARSTAPKLFAALMLWH